jgi:hypothetical protein
MISTHSRPLTRPSRHDCFSTFTPQIAHANPPRPITTDDLERDRVLAQRIALFGWIEPLHLDVPTAEGSNGFLLFAQQG